MRILEAARDEDGAFPYQAFLSLFLEVRAKAQWATAQEMLDFVELDFSRLEGFECHSALTRMRVKFIARALKEYALQAWKLGPAERDPAALPLEDTLFRTVH